MIFSQHLLECLSQASYLIGDEATGRAVVVDPRRDVQAYLDEAAAHGLTIERVIETHVHADFVSGHLELAARTGAVTCYGAGAAVGFPVEHLHDGQRLRLGDVVLQVLATPGHTPESICLVVHEHGDDADAVPYGVLTGDTLLVGDVGRPDLSSPGGPSAEDCARRLYRSLHDKLLALPDATRVFPAHGAGSACGRQLSSEPSSTIGHERRTNPALAAPDEDAFVALVCEGRPPRPRYVEWVARCNREARALLDEAPPPRLGLEAVLGLQRDGAVLLDGREPEAFALGHLRGAVNVGLGGRFAEWAAAVLAPDRDVVLVGEPATAVEAKVRLGRVGYDRVVGQLDDLAGALADRRAGLVETSTRLTADELAARLSGDRPPQLVDVRPTAEAAAGVLPGAAHHPLATLVDTLGGLDPGRPVVTYCASGDRSQVAASLLRSVGFVDVADLEGGTAAWEAAGLPCEGDLVVLRLAPLNAETVLGALTPERVGPDAVLPAGRHYVRSHFPVPDLDPASWRLEVGGLVERPLRLGLDELRAMPSRTVAATLECAGNGRSGYDPPVPGEPWGLGAVGTAEWAGVPLADVLARAGVRPGAVEVRFAGADAGEVPGAPGVVRFERSLPLADALAGDVLLAHTMNGEPLPRQHGHPLRLVVPGWYGVASVKWLTEVRVVDEPFDGWFQVERYVFDPGGVPVRRQRVRAVVTQPTPGARVPLGDLVVRGLAWSGEAPVAAVEVSVGEGLWQPAQLSGPAHGARWRWWERVVRLERPGPTTVRARAVDGAGNAQPLRATWDRLGYGNNEVQVVPLVVG